MSSLLPALCFGKLPAFGDFIRFNANGQEIYQFDQWLQEGIFYSRQESKNAFEQTFSKSQAYFFWQSFEQPPFFITGILLPSRDQSGRRFPFLMALRGDVSHWSPMQIGFSPAFFAPFYERVLTWLASLNAEVKMSDIEEFIKQHGFDMEQYAPIAKEQIKTYFLQTKQELYWDQLFGDFDDVRRRLWWGELFSSTREFQKRPTYHVPSTFAFPLSAKESITSFESIFSLSVLQQLLGRQHGMKAFFWSAPYSSASRHCYAFLRQPTPQEYHILLQPEYSHDNIISLGHNMDRSHLYEYGNLHPQLLMYLDNPNCTLSALIQNIPKNF